MHNPVRRAIVAQIGTLQSTPVSTELVPLIIQTIRVLNRALATLGGPVVSTTPHVGAAACHPEPSQPVAAEYAADNAMVVNLEPYPTTLTPQE